MAAATGHKRVHFDVRQPGAYAVQLRLTPALLEALQRGHDAGHAASICFGEGPQGNAINVGDLAFPFNALPEGSCDLLRLGAGGGAAALVGAVRQKLMVHRNIADERSRVRARAEEAERKGSERKAQLLHGKPAAAGAGPRKLVHRATPPPGAPRGATPPPRQALTASMLAAPAGKPPAHPGAPRGPTPPPSAAAAPAAAKPMHKSASTGKLGARLGSAANLAPPQLAAGPLALSAARRGNLRACLIATLAERPMSMNAVKAVLADAAARIKSFKGPSKEQLERVLKAVAEFKAPGVYTVYPLLLKELEELSPAGAADGDVAPAAPRPSKKRASSAGPGPAPAPAPAAARPAAAVGGKRGRLDWTDDDDSEAELPPPQQRQRGHQPPPHQQHAAAPPPLPHASTSASPPSASGGVAGASSGSGGAAGGALMRRTSSSRGSDHADDSWIEEHADRQPEPASPITSKEEYRDRNAAFNSKYQVYFQLHQLIQAHKKDVEAMDAIIRGAASEADKDRHRAELQRLHQRRGERAKRWDAAYKVLHQELTATKARMAEFVRHAQEQAGHGAAPPLRVK